MTSKAAIMDSSSKREYVPTETPTGLEPSGSIPSLSEALLTSFGAELDTVPKWWSKTRDEWLVKFWKRRGNDLLAGAVSTLVSKIASTNWYLEGPEHLVDMYRNMLLHQSNFGAGWDDWITKWVTGYLSRDMGGISVRHRANASDLTGPSLGFSHVDESRCFLTGDPEYPVAYAPSTGKKLRKIRREHVMRIVDMPSGKLADRGFGFCSVSRAVSTAEILRLIVKYKGERLSDLPPSAIMFISNLTQQQWKDIVQQYDTRQRNDGNTVWRDLLVAFGFDPEHPVSVDMFELSSLPEHYDERVATEIAVYTFALAFRVDPREYWPVSAGPLGTATEATIQHKKAKAKGEGIIFNAIEHQLNHPLSLPPAIKFRFDYRDDEEDMTAAEIEKVKIGNIRKMWEPAPNRQQFPASLPEESQPGRPNNRALLEEEQMEGLISTKEGRYLLALEGIIPADWVQSAESVERLYDVRTWGREFKRCYRDGTTIRMPV